MTHALKTWPEYYELILADKKKFEIRENDRDFKEGDVLLLQEFDPEKKKYTGKEMSFRVGFMVHGPAFGVKKGYCVIQLEDYQ